MNMCTWVLNAILAFATRRSLRVVERACDVVPTFTTRRRQGQVKRHAVLAGLVSDVGKKRQNRSQYCFISGEFLVIRRDLNHTSTSQSNNDVRLNVHLFWSKYMVHMEQYDMKVTMTEAKVTK